MTTYSYDGIGRITQRMVNATIEATWSFDSQCNGLPDSEQRNDSSFERAYVYDSKCRPVTVNTTIENQRGQSELIFGSG